MKRTLEKIMQITNVNKRLTNFPTMIKHDKHVDNRTKNSENSDEKEVFFKVMICVALLLVQGQNDMTKLMMAENFSNSAAQFLLVGACGCAHSISCFQDDLSILKAFTLKVFLNVPSFFFLMEWQVYLLNSFVPFQKQIKQPCHTEPHLSCSRVPGSTPGFFSTMEVRLNGCLATCRSERLLRKKINCSILHRFALLMPTLAH